MKTPCEVLFEQHQAAEAKLDAIREKVVAGLATEESAGAKQMTPIVPRQASAPGAGWGQFWWSLRWHLAGLSAVWLVVVALSIDPTPAPTRRLARQDTQSPRQLLAVLRENQRQLRELIDAPAVEPAPKPQRLTPSPRSQLQPFSTTPA
jgi:hypothetical protein